MPKRAYDLRLRPELVKELVGAPEHGLGYHLVDIRMTDGRVIENVPVLNSEFAQIPGDLPRFRSADIASLQLHGRAG
jgi:hypothetical protein